MNTRSPVAPLAVMVLLSGSTPKTDVTDGHEEIRVVAKPGEPISSEDVRRAVEASEYPYDYTVR